MNSQERFASLLRSDAPVALVVQGGGMRGTYSIAALSAFEDAGLTHRFADIFGTSAGALNGAYFMARQSSAGVKIYVDHLSNKRFINRLRVSKIIDIDYLVDEVLTHQVPLDVSAVEDSPIRLHIGMTSASTGNLVWVNNDRQFSLMESLRATAALPIVYGREVAVGQDHYVDGGVSVKVPLLAALGAGYQDVVVILTRALDYESTEANPLLGVLMRTLARAKGHSPAVVSELGKVDPTFPRVLELLRAGVPAPPTAPTRVWVVAPTEPIAGRLTADRHELQATAECGYRDAAALLKGYVSLPSRGSS